MAALVFSAVVRGTLVDNDVLASSVLIDDLVPGFVPAALLLLAFLGKQRGLLPGMAPVAVIGLIVVTPTFANLLGESPLLGWVVALLPLVMWQVDARKAESKALSDLASMSYQGAIAMLVPAVLASTGRLTFGEGTETEVLLVVAALLYGLSLIDRTNQVGVGGLIAHFASAGTTEEEDEASFAAGSPLDHAGLMLSIVM